MIKALDFSLDPAKVVSILNMTEEQFQEYKHFLYKIGKINLVKRG